MNVSNRIAQVSPSPTVALNAKAKAMSREGIDVINLSVGEPDFATPEAITQVGIAALQAGKTKYGAAGGGPEIRAAIVKKLARDNQLTYDANQVVVGVGAKEILFHAALALLNEGDEVLIPAPYWVSYTAHCQAAGAKGVVVPMAQTDDGCLTVTPEQLEAHATDKTAMVILNSPNNPGGYILGEKELRTLGAYLQEKDWWIIADEIYEYLSFENPHHSLLNVCPELRDKTILVNGLSKGFAMTGWRVGYGVGPERAMKLIKILQTQSSTCLPPFVEEAATFALEQGAAVMQSSLALLNERRQLVIKLLQEAKVDFVPPEGAFYVFIDLRKHTQDSLAFGERLLTDHHVAMVPGEAFGAPGFLRMSYASSEDNLRQGVARLVNALSEG